MKNFNKSHDEILKHVVARLVNEYGFRAEQFIDDPQAYGRVCKEYRLIFRHPQYGRTFKILVKLKKGHFYEYDLVRAEYGDVDDSYEGEYLIDAGEYIAKETCEIEYIQIDSPLTSKIIDFDEYVNEDLIVDSIMDALGID